MKSTYRILLAPTWELAQALQPEATVEAEYGEHVLCGSIVTLAHHVEAFQHKPAPCVAEVNVLPEQSTIVVSHIDLDTIGGLMSLMGTKPNDNVFWEGAAFIDTHGPHHAYTLNENVQHQLNAYWAWSSSLPRTPRATSVTDVTDIVLLHSDIIQRILSFDVELLAAGEKWATETSEKVEACLVKEDAHMRVFKTKDAFCAASYYSPHLQIVASATVSYNTEYRTITVATSDGSFNCCDLMQTLFGWEAGGHAGIAGSPRGQKMTEADFERAILAVQHRFL